MLTLHLLPRTHCFSGQARAVSVWVDGAVRKLKTTCGNVRFSQQSINHLRLLGHHIDAGHQPLVFDDGFVDRNPQSQSEEITNAKSHTGTGSQTRSRKGQRARARPRPSRQAKPFRSGTIEEAHGAEFRILAQHYEALGFEDRNGLWVAVKTNPLGRNGPQAHLLVAIPINRAIAPRAWAFGAIGPRARLFPLKHTNFPDASICAFTKASRAWHADDGLLPLIDHYSLWMIKSWHREILGWWPGPQVGACALYRRREFVGKEWCGCESGKRYSECHQCMDLLVPEEVARQEFRRLFRFDYENQRPPNGVLEAARGRWKQLPDMAMIFTHRLTYDEPQIPLI